MTRRRRGVVLPCGLCAVMLWLVARAVFAAHGTVVA